MSGAGNADMRIEAIVFDIGQTLAYYPIPLNWSKLYRPAFENVAEKLGLLISEKEFLHIGNTLTKYNTRINLREVEVSSEMILREIIDETNISGELLPDIRREFYRFFRTDTKIYPEAERTLAEIKRRGIPVATLSDVAYGMDNTYALEDIGPLLKYIDLPYTSYDIGYRKPRGEGLLRIASELNLEPSAVAFTGDEQKDIVCAHNAGAAAILINRSNEKKNYGQDIEIRDLSELLEIAE